MDNKSNIPPSDQAEGEDFEAWWKREGQFVRAGGGDYEKCFAYAAWNYAHPKPPQPDSNELVERARALVSEFDAQRPPNIISKQIIHAGKMAELLRDVAALARSPSVGLNTKKGGGA
jgi:hypothetical protein